MSDELNTKMLDKIVKSLTDNSARVRVGIMGQKNQRKDDGSNASIGLKHEFGDPNENLPIRSFLRVPISENMQKYIDNSGAFDKGAMKQVIQDKSIVPWLKKLGVLAESIVSDAFDSGGFGKWKPSNMEHKKNHQTLVETTQLRNSITSEVKE